MMPRPKNPEIRDAILAAALAELEKTGPEAVTMRRVAGRAGITATTIYYYYKNRDELFEAVKFRYLDDLASRLIGAESKTASYTRRIRAFMRGFADWCFDNPGPARLVMARLPADLSPSAEKLPRYYRANAAARELLAGAVESGELGSRDLELDVAVGLGALWGTVQLTLDHRFDPSLWGSGKAVVDRAIDVFLSGLSATPKGRKKK
jgi:AcrR family transcriptional regulator